MNPPMDRCAMMKGDDPRFPYVRVPMFLFNRERFPWMTPSIICTYVVARSWVYWKSRSNDRFGRCWPALATIAKRAGQSPSTVKTNLAVLEKYGLMYRQRRFNNSSIITFVDAPGRFQEIRGRDGRIAAEHDVEIRLQGIRDAARQETAEEARQRKPASILLRTREASNGNHRQPGRESQPEDQGGASGCPTPVNLKPLKNEKRRTTREEHTSADADARRDVDIQKIKKMVGSLRKTMGSNHSHGSQSREQRIADLRRQAADLTHPGRVRA